MGEDGLNSQVIINTLSVSVIRLLCLVVLTVEPSAQKV